MLFGILVFLFREILDSKKRYEIGVEKLVTAGAEVAIMQANLEALQPQLVIAAENVQKTMVIVEEQKQDASVVEKNIQADEVVAGEQAKGLYEEFPYNIDRMH